MNAKIVTRVYNNYAKIYNLLFGHSLDSGRKKAIKMMRFSRGDRILEVGIGTGLSLRKYPSGKNIKITGIDLSDRMLCKAKQQVKTLNRIEVELACMDGEQTTFPNDSFDKVVLMYVYSVTPNPEALLSEASRVCRAGGDIYIVNHFSHSKADKLSMLERLFSSLSEIIGFRSDFSYKKNVSSLHYPLVSVANANLFSLTKVIHLKNLPAFQVDDPKSKLDEAVPNI